MGNSCNVCRPSFWTSAETNPKESDLPLAKQATGELPQSEVATKPNPADFMLMSRKNETIVREPGWVAVPLLRLDLTEMSRRQINGEQFLIDGCEVRCECDDTSTTP